MSEARASSGTRGRATGLARILMMAGLCLAAVAPLACSGDEGCDGKVDSRGKCEKACNAALCPVAGSTCFDNACAAPCPTGNNATECALGSRCETLLLDDGGTGPYCAVYPFGKDGKTGQGDPCKTNDQCDVARGWECVAGVCANNNKRYEPCAATAECDEAAGYACVDGECRVAGCQTHEDCAVVGECLPGTMDTGTKVLACTAVNKQPPGQFHAACPLLKPVDSCTGDGDCDAATQICAKDSDGKGRCAAKCTAEDKALCAASESCLADADGRTFCTECDIAQGFTCLGAGPGDIDAYCTKGGCQADSDCGTGFFCSTVRTGRVPCQTACGITGQPSTPNCVPPEKIGAGQEFSCGPVSMLRNLCIKREFCNECNTDADCLASPNQLCSADSGGRKICTTVCDPNTNSCPWGNAATCGDWDGDGVFTCSHKHSTGCAGAGKSCEPCLDDADCPGGLCLQSDFTQEKYCVDLGPSCSCEGLPTTQNVFCLGGGCPLTPGGLTMNCYGGSQVQAGGSPLYNKCVGANVNPNPNASPQGGCWPN